MCRVAAGLSRHGAWLLVMSGKGYFRERKYTDVLSACLTACDWIQGPPIHTLPKKC